MTEHAIITTAVEQPRTRGRNTPDTAMVPAPVPAAVDAAAANEASMEAAPSPIPGLDERPCYVVLDDPHKDDTGKVTHRAGVWYFGYREGKGEDSLPTLTEKWICSPLHVDAVTEDGREKNFGRLLRYRNTYGNWHTWAMPMELLKGDGNDLRGVLLGAGVQLDPDARQSLPRYLQSRTPKVRMRCVLQTGWADTKYRAFVLPDMVIGAGGGSVVFQSGEADGNEYTTGGTLQGWQDEVAALAPGNPVLMLALCAAFAGPVMARCNAESGGLHLVGDSSTGKTTAIEAACSVWGGAGYRRSWRATSNGMEGVAALFNDSLLALDEISECDPRAVGEIIYSLGNGRGKQRASRSGTARAIHRWRCMILSTGERTIATTMQEGGHRVKAGQSVRLLDVPVQREYGAWDELHGHPTGTALSDAIKRAAATHYGHAGRQFLERLTRHHDEDFGAALDAIKALPQFAVEGDGQIKRAAARFALLALAGELATSYGVTGWEEGAATEAAGVMFAEWLKARGGNNTNMEQHQVREAVASFIEAHGSSRFQAMGREAALVYNRAGWRDESRGSVRYLFTSAGIREAVKGFELRRALDILEQCGALPPAKADGKRSTSRRVGGGEQAWVYEIDPDKLHGGEYHGTT